LSLFELGIELEEEIISLSPSDLESLNSRVVALSAAAKRSLFSERVPKPVFFDTAFNYIDLPMEELEVLAGKKKAAAGTVKKVAQTVEKAVPAAASEAVKSAVNTVKGRQSREATPAAEEEQTEGKPKGWLGGWFGRG
jgi:signal recognition particle subunit SRP68